jgi:major membrane immunogen (membrane-anchored lipoprotein)
VYFITEDISVRLPAGLLGVVAGTRVQMVADRGTMLQVTDGQDTFEVKKSQVTNEIEAATAMQRQAQAAQAASDQYRQQSDKLLQKQRQDYIDFLKAHPLSAPTPTPSPGR